MEEQPVHRHGLIGHTGFVGCTLQRQARFSHVYRSSDIESINGQEFDLLICAGAPAQKWIANQYPEADHSNLRTLFRALRTVKCNQFVLISTVDVFAEPYGVNELTPVIKTGLHAYGLHRRELEEVVLQSFPSALLLRLPGLVGPGLRKNVLYDLKNHHEVEKIDHRAIYQFYPMVNLWSDILLALHNGLKLLHCTAEPISVREICETGFGLTLTNPISAVPARYDVQSCHAAVMGGQGKYLYSKRESLQAIRAYAQSANQADSSSNTAT